MKGDDHSTRDAMSEALAELLNADSPSQFAPWVLGRPLASLCARLGLPQPEVIAGNLVVGNLDTAQFVLCAHLDEASFSVTRAENGTAWLTPLHRFDETSSPNLRLVGVRNGAAWTGPVARLTEGPRGRYCAFGGDVRLGDRAVYYAKAESYGTTLAGKAVDDRTGAVISLFAAVELLSLGIKLAVVLSDGEQNAPDGYFSRTFPNILSRLDADAIIVFIDGIFEDGLRRAGLTGPQAGALVVPHTGDGRGYCVPPLLFARLRDIIVPGARAKGIDVQVTSAYHSRGDDWGMVTNPVFGVERSAIFVSFGGWGSTPERRTVDTRGLDQCRMFTVAAAQALAASG